MVGEDFMVVDKVSAERMERARADELKAREFRVHGEWSTVIPQGYPEGVSRWEDRYAAAFAAEEVRLERERCAKAVCMVCRQGCQLIETASGSYTHVESYCVAAAIWELSRGRE